jgi:hypothetical protein
MKKRSLAAIAVAALVMGTALVLAPSTSSAEPARPRVESHVVTHLAEAVPAVATARTAEQGPIVAGQQYPPQRYFFSFRLSLNLLFLRLTIEINLGSFLRNSRVVVESRRLGLREVTTAGADGTAALDTAIPASAEPGRYTLVATGQSEDGPLKVTSVVDVPSKAERAETAASVLERPITAAGITALGQGVTLPASTETAAPAAVETETAAPTAAAAETAAVAEAAAPSGAAAPTGEVAVPAESVAAPAATPVKEVAVPADELAPSAAAVEAGAPAKAGATGDLPHTGAGGGTQAAARIAALLLAFGGLLLLAARRRTA